MAEAERASINVPVGGEDLELILPGQGWTFEEAKLAKAVSEGMPPVEIERGLELADPDAWLAVLRVSYMRANREFPADKISMTDILELADAVSKAVRETRRSVPPTSPNGKQTSEPGGSSERTLAESQS